MTHQQGFSTESQIQKLLLLLQLLIIRDCPQLDWMQTNQSGTEQNRNQKDLWEIEKKLASIAPLLKYRSMAAIYSTENSEFLFCKWENGKIQQNFRDSLIIAIYKNIVGKWDCLNHQRITLLSIARRNLSSILLNRLVLTISDNNLSESLGDIFAECRTTDRNKTNGSMPCLLTWAFGWVSRIGTCKIQKNLGCPWSFSQWSSSTIKISLVWSGIVSYISQAFLILMVNNWSCW